MMKSVSMSVFVICWMTMSGVMMVLGRNIAPPEEDSLSVQISRLSGDCPNYPFLKDNSAALISMSVCNETHDGHFDDWMCRLMRTNMQIVCSEERNWNRNKDSNEDLVTSQVNEYLRPEEHDICADLKANLTAFDCHKNPQLVDCPTANQHIHNIRETGKEYCINYCEVTHNVPVHLVNPICKHLLFTAKVIKLKFPEFITQGQFKYLFNPFLRII